MIKLSLPFTEEKIRALKVGDEVLISGVVFTGRDAVRHWRITTFPRLVKLV